MYELSKANAAYISRLKSQLKEKMDISDVPEWIVTHTTSPRNPDLPFSFKGHEYQKEMIADQAPISAVRKCSQVGATEIWFRAALAMLAIFKSLTLIYVLPTVGFVRKVSKGRVDPIIRTSQTLSQLIDPKVDNNEMKRFMNSFLYLSGSYGKSSGISVPAQAVFKDEVDFCNQSILSTFASRMGHSKEDEFLDRSFSTPTVFDFGIDLAFKRGSQAYYNVKCPTCKKWTELDYMNRVEIPGFDGDLELFEKEDLLNPRFRVDEAFMRCGCCNAPLPYEAFLDPNNRKWIHRYPEKAAKYSSRQIYPLDVPEVNPLSRTIRHMADYKRKKDWANFKIGVPYQDAESSFVEELVRTNSVSFRMNKPGPEPVEVIPNAFFGLDVGKTVHLCIGVPNNQVGGLDVIYAERIRQDGDNRVLARLKELSLTFKFVGGVVDAGPDITLAQSITAWRPGVFWACTYVEAIGKSLDILRLNDDERVVLATRTATLDDLCHKTNKGVIRLNRSQSEFELFVSHLKSMKKVAEMSADEAEFSDRENWISTDEDHYAHALNYLNIARSISEIAPAGDIIPFDLSVLTAKIKQEGDKQEEYLSFREMWARMGRRH